MSEAEGGRHWPKTGTTHYHAHLVLSDQSVAIKGSAVCISLDISAFGSFKWSYSLFLSTVPWGYD